MADAVKFATGCRNILPQLVCWNNGSRADGSNDAMEGLLRSSKSFHRQKLSDCAPQRYCFVQAFDDGVLSIPE